jgi:hypothetical protein
MLGPTQQLQFVSTKNKVVEQDIFCGNSAVLP